MQNDSGSIPDRGFTNIYSASGPQQGLLCEGRGLTANQLDLRSFSIFASITQDFVDFKIIIRVIQYKKNLWFISFTKRYVNIVFQAFGCIFLCNSYYRSFLHRPLSSPFRSKLIFNVRVNRDFSIFACVSNSTFLSIVLNFGW